MFLRQEVYEGGAFLSDISTGSGSCFLCHTAFAMRCPFRRSLSSQTSLLWVGSYPSVLRTRYALSGTPAAYAASAMRCPVWAYARYAMSSTDMEYAATRESDEGGVRQHRAGPTLSAMLSAMLSATLLREHLR
eukprot:1762002-Rhodomonas_salina.3